MKSERFKRTRSVMASGAIALVVAALAFGVSSFVLGPKSAIARAPRIRSDLWNFEFHDHEQHLHDPLCSGTYPATSCSGTPALLSPGVTRCVVFSVHNSLKAAISVQSITTALDTTNYAAPPADCSGTNLVLPTFSGSFNVAGGGDATSPGVPVELRDNSGPQDDCENYTYHFVYTGSANYTEVYGTATGLGSSQNPSTTGQSVTYTATVTASATSSQDPVPSSPTGAVTFKDNGATICSAPVALTSTGTTTATAQCTVTYATTAGSPHPITASYANTDGNFTNSSASLSQVVTSGSIPTTSVLTSSPNPSTYGSPVTFTDTVSPSSPAPRRFRRDLLQLWLLDEHLRRDQDRLGSAAPSPRVRPPSRPRPAGGHDLRRGDLRGAGNYLGSTSNIVAQVVNALGTTSVLTCRPTRRPRLFGHLHRHGVGFFGTPSGTVTFYSCTTSGCTTKTSLGTGTLSSGKATYSTSTLPVGTTYVEAVYGASGNYATSTSNVVTQVVNALGTTSVLTSSSNPSTYGSSVTFTDTVSASSGTPSGTVTFYSCTTSGCTTKTSLGTGTLSSGKATYSTSTLPVGTTYVEAVYGASGNYATSTSNVVTQVVNALGTTSVLDLVVQPVHLRLLGHLHRHGVGFFGYPEWHGDLLQLHHFGLHHQDLARDRDPQQRQGHLLDLDAAGGHYLRGGGLRGFWQLRRPRPRMW